MNMIPITYGYARVSKADDESKNLVSRAARRCTTGRRGPGGVKATARSRRSLGREGKRLESAERASWRGRMDWLLLSVLRDGLMRRSEAAALT